ncbi:MAG: hypothetical protein NXI21_01925 [Alphaproteobacteria bacterium]|nr:hypothetical protein [Alphaproteobacteria bacterium]
MAKTKAADVAKDAALAEIEALASEYQIAHQGLANVVGLVEDRVRAIHAEHALSVRAAAEAEAAAHSALIDAVDRNRALFKSPKSRIFYGVKLGLKKAQDSIRFDAGAVVRRIQSLLPGKADELLRRTVEVNRDALKRLSQEELRQLGVCRVIGADAPFAGVEKSDAAKAAAAILESAEGDGQ